MYNLFSAKKPPGKPCQGRPTDGPCTMEVSGYKFDPDSNSCIKFVGGGCGYSNNGFGTKDDCEAKCSTSSIKSKFMLLKEFLKRVDFEQ